ncbi:hypothetical protein EDB81DRAFT_890213 [Dactylonectria macrodidyma]|uniref:Uncharacterized protein n=1 Tax=Dactylonectria macrodidyma TaxID=307937 RepID=A0A9P9DT23_9HYPO|nr:hypothetical protein EDB81DRAFT_890213 [Dactylonectria macrodidyma]
MTPGFGPGGTNDQPPDVYDRLGKSLEIVQNICEYDANQVLRDGDCNDEITKVQEQLTEVLKEAGELTKIQTRQPISMRRKISAGLKDGAATTPAKDEQPPKLEAAEPALNPNAPLEVVLTLSRLTTVVKFLVRGGAGCSRPLIRIYFA